MLVEKSTTTSTPINHDATLSFSIVYPNKEGRFVMRDIGKVSIANVNGSEDGKTLKIADVEMGDYLSVAIIV